MVDIAAREEAVLALLDRWPWDTGGVLIGGYATSAYGHPRYSNDVDVVVPAKSLPSILSWLRKRGFEATTHAVPNPQNFEGHVYRFVSNPITLDLLAGAVRDREAHVDIPERWISKRCKRMILETLSGRTLHPIPVARPEALWALKLQSGRDHDLSDLFVLSDQPANLREVRQLFEQLATDSLSRKFGSVLSRLGERRLFEDSLSRRQLGSPKRLENIKRWERFTSSVESIIGPLAPDIPSADLALEEISRKCR